MATASSAASRPTQAQYAAVPSDAAAHAGTDASVERDGEEQASLIEQLHSAADAQSCCGCGVQPPYFAACLLLALLLGVVLGGSLVAVSWRLPPVTQLIDRWPSSLSPLTPSFASQSLNDTSSSQSIQAQSLSNTSSSPIDRSASTPASTTEESATTEHANVSVTCPTVQAPPSPPSADVPALFAAYTAFHRDMVSRPPQSARYLVSVAVEAGFADRIVGTIMAFYLAFFSGRALQLVTYAYLPAFEAAFSQPHINWTRGAEHRESEEMEAELIEPLKYTYKGQRGYNGNRSYDPAVIPTSRYALQYDVNAWDSLQYLFYEDLREFPFVPAQSVFFSSNRGRSHRMVEQNHIMRSVFEQLGVRPETAFADAWHYLFSPSPAVVQRFQPVWDALADLQVIKISINIRVGDDVFDPAKDEQVQLESFDSFFRCAQEIEQVVLRHRAAAAPDADASNPSTPFPPYLPPARTRVLWYLTSDSKHLRELAVAKYGTDKLVTDALTAYVHGDCGAEEHKNRTGCDAKSDERSNSIVSAVGQVYAMAKCDYHIYKLNTGFGRVGAWLSRRSNHIFLMPSQDSHCQRGDVVSHQQDGMNWSGI